MREVRLVRIDPARNMRRFYVLQLVPTLFGEWAVIREWGRIGHPGRLTVAHVASADDGEALVARKVREKRRRGYAPAGPQSEAVCVPAATGSGRARNLASPLAGDAARGVAR